MKVLSVFGTRPEAIKMLPLIKEMKKTQGIDSKVILTGQHKEIVEDIMAFFNINEDYNLNIMKSKQTLTEVTTGVMCRIEPILLNEKPDIILVHGDTSTAFSVALASFYHHIDVGHVEAGLRTGNMYSPFPEEINRIFIDRIAKYHFAPTKINKENLIREGITENNYITGNTVIDSFQYTVKDEYTFTDTRIAELSEQNKLNDSIVITAHRRENIGQPLYDICNAIKELADRYKDKYFIYPVHLNPSVKEIVFEVLSGIENVILIKPIGVMDMHNLIARCFIVVTDSGGLQEEAPYFGKPVLVIRKETERPEAVEAGTVKVIGTDKYDVINEVSELIENKRLYRKMSLAINPYGDGNASKRIIRVLLKGY